MNKPQFYLVWKQGSSGTTPTYKHPTYESAKTECERLTRKHGGQFHILAHVATAKKVDVIFDEIEKFDDDIPF